MTSLCDVFLDTLGTALHHYWGVIKTGDVMRKRKVKSEADTLKFGALRGQTVSFLDLRALSILLAPSLEERRAAKEGGPRQRDLGSDVSSVVEKEAFSSGWDPSWGVAGGGFGAHFENFKGGDLFPNTVYEMPAGFAQLVATIMDHLQNYGLSCEDGTCVPGKETQERLQAWLSWQW